MAETRGGYKTRQRELVMTCLSENAERYLTVDEIWILAASCGEGIGRTTVYRSLERLVAEGGALKATAPGGESRYRIASDGASSHLLCLTCGRAYPLDCHMVEELTSHVLEHHGFKVDPTRTVLYGTCSSCLEGA